MVMSKLYGVAAVTANFQLPIFNGQSDKAVKTQAKVLQERTMQFALRVTAAVRSLPPSAEARVTSSQLLRSATSVAANYRAACRGRSRPEFLAKLGIVEQEADETIFWLEMIIQAKLLAESRLANLLKEAREITAIMVASKRTVKRNNRKLKIGN
jgi:four helix bundle protein